MNLDLRTFEYLNGFAGNGRIFDFIILFFAQYSLYVLIALFLILLFFSADFSERRARIFLVVFISSLVARFGIASLIRFFYQRPRPFVLYPVNQLIPESSFSFPSGHATFFFAFSAAIFFYNRKWGLIFFAASFLMGIARVMAGVHYPSDILGGIFVGTAVGYGANLLYETYQERNARKTLNPDDNSAKPVS